MANQVWLIVDHQAVTPTPVAGQQAAWLLDIPDGSTALEKAADFAGKIGFPVGTVARVIDLTANPLVIQTFQLTSTWQPV